MTEVTYGTVTLQGDRWIVDCQPHVAMVARRLFTKCRVAAGELDLPADDSTSRDLQWFLSRYPMIVDERLTLDSRADAHRDHILRIEDILSGHRESSPHSLVFDPRPHQSVASDWINGVHRGILADEVGLGKTYSAVLAATTGNILPTLVVCPKHIVGQWKQEILRFAPTLSVYVVKSSKSVPMADKSGRLPDFVICTYTMLHGWAAELSQYCKFVVFDECQELRADGSRKYSACMRVVKPVPFRLGLSATPIYNYGGEIFSVLNVIAPGKLGHSDEFNREWCAYKGRHQYLKDSHAFGSWLRSSHLMLRRTRDEVGRSLPGVQRITHTVDVNRSDLEHVKGRAGELARIILSETETHRGQKMHAAEEFSNVLRQATGIAKAPYVAAFVDMLIQNGEKVLLFGWHHAVYDIWCECLREHNPVMFTGQQSATQKKTAFDAFVSGDSRCLIMSLRSGSGLDGLQYSGCGVTVFGEADFSPSVHEQCIGRTHRDGQESSLLAYFLMSEHGIDPILSEILGLKSDQSDGILSVQNSELTERVDSSVFLRRLAEKYVADAKF